MLIPYQELSEEQKSVIRRVSREPGDLFVEGPPGSGKTLISLYTLADIVKESNVRPLLLIYNHSLFGYLSSALSELRIKDNVTVETKDKFFRNMAISKPNPSLPYDVQYAHILNDVSNQELIKTFDLTLVDEVQDISKKEWEIINRISKRVLALGDFNQGVYKTDLSREHITKHGFFERLSQIFRFHKNIAKLAQTFSKTNENLEKLVSKDSSVQPKIIDVDTSNIHGIILEILNDIKAYKKRIGIISPDRDQLKLLSDFLKSNNFEHFYFESNRDLRTHDFSSTEPLLITSNSSKGLEFENVILFGFEKNNEKVEQLISMGKLKDVIYVSITRTNNNLFIIKTKDTVDELKELVLTESNSNELESLDDLI